ncbi:class I adenylate-forming enzyme family protein [Rhodoligotrophos ferricapiens]|uniref:class I adenylate-forming enzyme family protein n=1 Tax=Rhodoligotrophos ferricapiens TaxID=3069264 RepID=UPI00315DBA6A
MPASVGSFVDSAAAKYGDKPAWQFIADGAAISYAELAACTQALARGFSDLGVSQGDRVAVMLPNIPGFPLSWLALARIGAAMVPVNTTYMPREVAYVVRDSGASVFVTTTRLYEKLREQPETAAILQDLQVVLIGDAVEGTHAWARLLERAGENEAPRAVACDDLLNIQYTSGTTGFPKGCMLTHRYWLTLSIVTAERLRHQQCNVLAAQPFYYMDPQWLLLMTMRIGGTLFVAEKASSSRFMDWVRRYDIGFCIFPEIVMKQPERQDDADNPLKAAVVFGLSPGMHSALEKRFALKAREGYGMTEVGSALITPFDIDDMVGTGTCGVTSPFRETTIRDGNGEPVKQGEAGELWVRGPGIMLGYWNKPEANAEVFRPGGWFRTGDLFRQDERGFHYLVGRLKDMIRRSGENIAAREIEAVLLEYPAIEQAAAIPVPDPVRGEEVKAVLVLRAGERFELDAFFAHCSARLAPFKVPRYVQVKQELPKTPSDRIAKHILLKEQADLRMGAYDRVEGVWR